MALHRSMCSCKLSVGTSARHRGQWLVVILVVDGPDRDEEANEEILSFFSTEREHTQHARGRGFSTRRALAKCCPPRETHACMFVRCVVLLS